MGAVAAFQGAENLAVEPGQVVTCQLSVANTGSIVEQFTLLVVGDAAEWIRPDPPVISLFPGAQQTVNVTIAPPRVWSTPAGEVHFAIKVIPSNEPEESVTEEAAVTVGSFQDVAAELVPRMVTARFSGRQKLAVDSRGNTPVPVEVAAVDAADAIKFTTRPKVLTTAPGAAHFVRLRVKPRQRFWRGPPQQKPYRVQVSPEGGRPIQLEGGLVQKAVLPKWLVPLVAIAGILALLWFLWLKPAVHSYAINANKSAIAAQQRQTASLAKQVQANQAATQANQAANAANAASIAALSGKKPPPTTTTTTLPPPTTVPPPVTGPTDGRLETVAAPGTTATSATDPIGKSSTLQVTDIVIQNVSGSTGTARIERVIPGQAPVDLLVENLGTLTDQEFRFTTPIVFTHDQRLQLRIDCGANQTACDVGMYWTGPLTEPQSATTTTIP